LLGLEGERKGEIENWLPNGIVLRREDVTRDEAKWYFLGKCYKNPHLILSK